MASDDDLTTARAAADQQMAHVDGSMTKLVARARAMLAKGVGRTETWTLLSVYVANQLDCRSAEQKFAAQMLAAAVLRLADELDPPTG